MFGMRIVPINCVKPHEEFDKSRVEKLKERLRAECVLKNPLIVAEHKGFFVLLDGVNRLEALKKLNCKDVLVQVVDYEKDAKLETWKHSVKSIEGVKKKRIVIKRKKSLPETIKAVFNVTKRYKGTIRRLDDCSGSNSGVTVSFPRFSKEEIIKIATSNKLLPPGITKHVVKQRCLSINVDLALLKSRIALKSKNAVLREIINQRISNNRLRIYKEETLVFDD